MGGFMGMLRFVANLVSGIVFIAGPIMIAMNNVGTDPELYAKVTFLSVCLLGFLYASNNTIFASKQED